MAQKSAAIWAEIWLGEIDFSILAPLHPMKSIIDNAIRSKYKRIGGFLQLKRHKVSLPRNK